MKTIVKNVIQDSLRGFKVANSKDYDECQYFKILSGRLTKARYKALQRFARHNSKRIPVYSDYDCTGQLCGVYTDVIYGRGRVLIRIRFTYDY